MKKTFVILIVLVSLLAFSSCRLSAKKKINELGKLYENNENIFIFSKGITKNNETFMFDDLISKEVKAHQKKVRNERLYPEETYLIGDYYYFVFKYYIYAKNNGNTIKENVTGYININTLKVTLYNFYENNEDIRIFKFYDKIVFTVNDEALFYKGDNHIKTLPLNGYRGVSNLYSNQLIFLKEVDKKNEYLIIDNDFSESKFTFDKDITLFYFDNVLLITLNKGEYKGLNLKDNLEIEQVKLEILIDDIKNIYNVFVYKGRRCNYLIFDDYENEHKKRGYLKIESGDFNKIIKLSTIKEKVLEITKVEEIFKTEIYFNDVIGNDDNIYLTLVNQETFFGFYSGRSSLPIVIKYDLENDSFEYMGYYGATFYNLIKVIQK